ncbi:DNA mismatch repair protein MutL [Reticulibacter mediterranei]|uniref:DNA mismatch repair protein MutL n=1 Tax=Reticulibacter mediterranei TaxID=2778369 RepID=A0A8J3N296_9CHLR|nr:DNA mismatch repair endonuclease MutL [Reticulibacter mediterranei]GHO92965.1 DNA mismatch repair protein MutL [Reticulibacter mediterranei]
MPIRQLASDVAAKIAAGEVVERPASVVKELIENSIDAGATQIRVDLMNGGLQLIRVTDNGSGIAADELPLALSRHATSKVEQIDDLEHIRSLGFRGEALASIAAVAEVTLLSRPRTAEQGAQISASSGKLSDITPAASPQGTTLTVRNLFSAVPARLKFLKSRNTEVGHCHHLLEQYALAYPEIRFTVFSEGRQIFGTPGDGQLSSVLVEVYGLPVAEQMAPLVSEGQDDDPERPRVSGYTSLPTCYKSTRQHISFFVNRRWVLSRMLTAAVEGAYHSLLLSGRHPIAVINIQVDPALLDVNVHPAKTEIRFLKERRVFAAILRAVRAALLEEPEMPQWSSQKKAPVVTPTTSEEPQEEPASAVVPQNEGEAETTTLPQDNPWLTVTEEETGTRPPLLSRLWQSHVRVTPASSPEKPITSSISESTDESTIENIAARFSASEIAATEAVELPLEPSSSIEPTTEFRLPPPPLRRVPDNISSLASSPERPSHDLTEGAAIDPTQARRLPRLRVVGQLSQSYIVTEGEDGMYLIDQHAAHERILLERMVASLKASTPLSQHMLTPLALDLAPSELEAIEDHQQQLTQIGFDLEVVDGKTLEMRAVPNVLVKQMNAHSLHELLIELTAAENLGHTETWEERALANVACKAAIKQNYFLTVSEMREMIEQLEQTKAPYSCCHGRPTMVHFSLSALEREFGRR